MKDRGTKPIYCFLICLNGLLMVICLVSCGSDEERTRKAVVARELGAIVQDYSQSTNLLSARTALTRHLAILQKWRDEGDYQLDFNFTMALVEARLYAIELELGNGELAELYFQKWSNHMAQANIRKGLAPPNYTTQQALQMVSIIDSNLVLRWKK